MSNQPDNQARQPTSFAYFMYLSSAIVLLTDSQLDDILKTALRNNADHGITGILAYSSGSFIQYVEGPRAELDQLERNLNADQRHRGMYVSERGEIAARAFPDWSMAFECKRPEGGFRPGASSFLSDGFLAVDPTHFSPLARRLLEIFRQNMR